MTEAISPTNQDVAARIGLTHSGVSRIRTGDRLPSVPTMVRIQEAYGWSVQEQTEARARGTYADDFERALTKEQF